MTSPQPQKNRIQLPLAPIEAIHWIGGRNVPGSGPTTPLASPYTNARIGSLHAGGAALVSLAVETGASAQKEWARTPIKERCAVMFRLREVLLRDLAELSQSISRESGKTLDEAKAEILKGIEVTEFALSLQNMEYGGKMEVSRGVTCEVRRQPLGVVAGITPFNFPAMVPMWMIPIALTLGNSFLWKPSDKTPLTSLLIARALKEAGLPDGVFNVVQGGRETVEAILDHPGISSVGFVGSTPIAKLVYARGTAAGKRVLALGGAKNHIILMPDADPEIAGKGIADSFTGCAGQRCMAASVVLAVGEESRALVEKVAEAASRIRLGEDMGALITRESNERLRGAIDEAIRDGARPLLDGRKSGDPASYAGGNWLAPTIIEGVKPGSRAATEELFGPVLSVIPVKNLSEALAIQNSGIYGNAASVFTNNGGVADRVAREARAGMIGVNIGVPVPREPFGFGGIAASKFGQGDITGPDSLDLWTDARKLTVKWAASSDHNWMS